MCRSTRLGATAAKLISPFTGQIVDYGIALTRFNAPHANLVFEVLNELANVGG